MSRLEEVGARDGWRCWLCDEPVDPDMSANDARGASIDSRSATTKTATKTKTKTKITTNSKGRPAGDGQQRLAHRSCNTNKGAAAAIVPWPAHLYVGDPAPIIGSVERLQRKSGREVMARCPTRADAEDAATWLTDRLSRLAPDLVVTTEVDPIGGHYLLILRA